jgi:hypothetical protein
MEYSIQEKMMSDNIPNREMIEKLARDLQLVNQQRTGSLKSLKDRLSEVLASEHINVSNMSQHTVKALRDLGFAVNAACQVLDANEKLLDMIVHDVTEVIQVHDKMAGHVLQTQAYTQTMLALLKKKGFTTDEELQAVWAELSAPPVTQE